MKKKENQFSTGLIIIGITAFFLGCFFLLLIFGTGIYRGIVSRQSENQMERALSSYLLTVSRNGEAGIQMGVMEDGRQVLIVEDGDSGYGSRIYLHEGYLVEDYGKIDGAYYPDLAIRIGENDRFAIEMIKEDLMKIETVKGNVYLHLRNGEVVR